MDTEQKLSLARENTAEVVTEQELSQVFSAKKNPVVYCGYEPSGPIHLGHLVTIKKLAQLEQAGCKVKILLADWHAFLNQKGTFDEIRAIGQTWEKTIRKLGLKNPEFVYGSSFQMKQDYFQDVLTLSLHTTLNRGLRAMQEVARDIENAKVSQVVYPLMQIADVKHLKVDIVQAGIEQRKIYMLGRETINVIGYNSSPLIFTPLISSLTGEGKMSSSKSETMISVTDTPEAVAQKISKAFCPEGIVEQNPVLEISRLIVFPHFGKIEVKRPQKFGGDKTFNSYTELEADFAQKKLHPMDLKKAVGELLGQMLKK